MRFLFRIFTNKEIYNKKLSDMEKKIAELENHLKENVLIGKETLTAAIQNNIANSKDNEVPTTTIKVDHLQVDQIIIEKLEYANNFGQLGIKELTGKLNIGTTYDGDISKKVTEKMDEKLKKHAKINIRAKKDK